MSLNEIMEFEMEGLVDTILDYTTEKFVRSYAKKLHGLSYPQEQDKILTLVNRLLAWYDINLQEIESSNYLLNKKDHLKCYNLLQEMKQELGK